MRAILITLALLALSGCQSYLLKPAADRYCSLPHADRAAYRALIDTRTEPHEVRIYCNANTGGI